MAKTADKYETLIRGLIRATEQGKIEWVPVDYRNFRAVVGDGAVRVGHFYEPPDEGDPRDSGARYSVTVMDSSVSVVDERRFGEDTHAARLFSLARRSATNAEQVIDKMLTDLAKIG